MNWCRGMMAQLGRLIDEHAIHQPPHRRSASVPLLNLVQEGKVVLGKYFYLNTKFLLLASVAVGKSSATGMVTLPVAAHSVPRKKVFIKPTFSYE